MAFKMKGPSMHKGTKKHSEALKTFKELSVDRDMDGTSVEDGRAGSSPLQVNVGSPKMKDFKIGSDQRKQEYDRRGWAHDETTQAAVDREKASREKAIEKEKASREFATKYKAAKARSAKRKAEEAKMIQDISDKAKAKGNWESYKASDKAKEDIKAYKKTKKKEIKDKSSRAKVIAKAQGGDVKAVKQATKEERAALRKETKSARKVARTARKNVRKQKRKNLVQGLKNVLKKTVKVPKLGREAKTGEAFTDKIKKHQGKK